MVMTILMISSLPCSHANHFLHRDSEIAVDSVTEEVRTAHLPMTTIGAEDPEVAIMVEGEVSAVNG